MKISFQCPSCGAAYSATEASARWRVRCPQCGAEVEMSLAQPVPEVKAGNPPGGPSASDAQSRGEEDVQEPAFQAKRRPEDSEMDMTPMVDVVFQLLIFFMLTAAFALQKSIAVPKSADDRPSENVVTRPLEEGPEYVTVRVDEFNTYHVIAADAEEEAPSVQDLHILLRRAREGSRTGMIATKLRVAAHGDASHGRVVAALDAGTATGFEEVQLDTVEADE